MPTREEMQHSIKFNRDRADMYQQIANQGGNGRWTKEAAQTEADRFTGYADQLAASLANRP